MTMPHGQPPPPSDLLADMLHAAAGSLYRLRTRNVLYTASLPLPEVAAEELQRCVALRELHCHVLDINHVVVAAAPHLHTLDLNLKWFFTPAASELLTPRLVRLLELCRLQPPLSALRHLRVRDKREADEAPFPR